MFKLVVHDSGVTYNFFASGYIRDITDRNANSITFAYTYDAASGEYFMASMTDTQGRVTTFTRAGVNQVSTVTDPAGRVNTYAYTTLSGEPVLATHSDPSGATTAYEYVSPGLLTKVTDPVGNVTTFTYSGQRLASLTRVSDPATGAGNQLGSSAGAALAYNGADQTTSLQSAGGGALSATYAGANQFERITAGPTSFTNTALGVTASTEAGVTTATTRDPGGTLVGLRSGSDAFYYLVDGLGSVMALTDSSGAVTHSYTYDPYGVTTETTSSAVANPWRYTGEYRTWPPGSTRSAPATTRASLGAGPSPTRAAKRRTPTSTLVATQ